MTKAARSSSKSITEPTNGAESVISIGTPYSVIVAIEGTTDLLLHAWNTEHVKAKAEAKKNSQAKKTDNIESYVYRNEKGFICLPGEYIRQAVIAAAKNRQDPRSPRKSAADLYKAGIIIEERLCSLGKKKWDYEDTRRVVIQRAGINRTRPAFAKGWRVEFTVTVIVSDYIKSDDLREVIEQAGRLVGVADFRPTFGRFAVVKFAVLNNAAKKKK
jgi:hypothetical protein